MFRRQVSRRVLVALGLLGVLIGCLRQVPTSSDHATREKALPPSPPTIAATPEYVASFHGVSERLVKGNCAVGGLCDDSLFTIHTNCTDAHLRYWRSSFCAMTTVFFDFDTSNLPNASQITETRLRVYYAEGKESPDETQPEPQGCAPPGGAAGPQLYSGVYRKAVSTVGGSLTPEDTSPWLCADWGAGHPGGISGTEGWVESVALTNCPPSLTQVSRYGLDVERGDYDFVQWAIDAQDNKPRLRVKYKVPYNPCLDGQITVSTNCTYCNSATFSVNSTATSATISKDTPTSGPLCDYGDQMAMVFDTDDLVDSHDIATAKLTFYVQSQNGVNYSTKTIAVYSRTSSTACASYTLGKDDFKGCGTLTSLGSITITSTSTSYTFTIPNPESNINQSGRTVLVLIDDTTLTDPEGSSHYFVISTKEHGTSSQWPKLEIEYN